MTISRRTARLLPLLRLAHLNLGGTPAADGDETSAVGWFGVPDLDALDLNDFNRALLVAIRPQLDLSR